MAGNGVVVWEWQNEYGTWRPYDPNMCMYLESNKASTIPLQLGAVDPKLHLYVVDIQNMCQIRQGTGTQRPMRRTVYSENSAIAKGIMWQWEADVSGTWNDFDSEITEYLEDNYINKNSFVDLSTSRFTLPYHVDLVAMTQTRIQTNRVRNIQRVKGLSSYPPDTSSKKGKRQNSSVVNKNAVPKRSKVQQSVGISNVSSTASSAAPAGGFFGSQSASTSAAGTGNVTPTAPLNFQTFSQQLQQPQQHYQYGTSSNLPQSNPLIQFGGPMTRRRYSQNLAQMTQVQASVSQSGSSVLRQSSVFQSSGALPIPNSAMNHTSGAQQIPNSAMNHMSGAQQIPNSAMNHMSGAQQIPNSAMNHTSGAQQLPHSAMNHMSGPQQIPNSAMNHMSGAQQISNSAMNHMGTGLGARHPSLTLQNNMPYPLSQQGHYYGNIPSFQPSSGFTGSPLGHSSMMGGTGVPFIPSQGTSLGHTSAMYQSGNLNPVQLLQTARSGRVRPSGSAYCLPNYDRIPNTVPKATKKSKSRASTQNDFLDTFVNCVEAPPPDEDCCICYERLVEASGQATGSPDDTIVIQLEKCSHMFHKMCLHAMYNNGPKDHHLQCPSCKTIYGEKSGNCPKGEMEYRLINAECHGYEGCQTYQVLYHIQSGTQGPDHPSPGKRFTCRGFPRIGYIPDCDKGRKVLHLLIVAWRRRLTFTIGTSTTTGEENTVTWNEIHHKTELGSNYSGHGYPDENYLDNVLMELAIHGITDSDLPS